MRIAGSFVPFLAGLIIGCSAAPNPLPAAPVDHETVAKDLEAKTVAIVNDEARSFCTGVWVARDAFLSAYHCFEDESFDGQSPSVGFRYVAHEDVFAPGSVRQRATIEPRLAVLIATDPQHDLALLRALGSLPSHRVARVALDTVHAGSHVHAMGHPLGLWWSYSVGDVAALRARELAGKDMVWIQTTTPISPGSSGCGLFDDAGNLVGIAHGAMNRGQGLNFFSHSQYLDAFLRRVGG